MSKLNLDKLDEALLVVESNVIFKGEFSTIKNVLLEAKALQAEHEALKKDVARYFELAPKFKSITKEKQIECYQLQDKLSKVGKKE